MLLRMIGVGLLISACSTAHAQVQFGSNGHTLFGDWYANGTLSTASWQPGMTVRIETNLYVSDNHLNALSTARIKPEGLCVLVTAERTFDADGWLRLASDERMSSLLTPTGIPIEGGIQGAVTNRYGYEFRTPLDLFSSQPLTTAKHLLTVMRATFKWTVPLPQDLPPGIYRVRLDYGVTMGKSVYSLNGESFARRPSFTAGPVESHLYSPPLRASGRRPSGEAVDGSTIKPRIPWVLLANYNSNGYRGAVAEEDRLRFGIAGRNLIQDDIILPLYSTDDRTRLSYSLEPQFPQDTIEVRSNIPWNFASGEMAVQVTGPDGKTVDLGKSKFVGNTGQWPTTKNSALTAWKPSVYGLYTVRATGWTADVWGNRYEGGGTYKFWIAKRMTLATATFQGMAYPVGYKYGRDIAFAPAVPADVAITAVLYVNSDPNNKKSISFSGKASPSGVFGLAQGNQQLPLDAPGEYQAQILARYTDKENHLWVSTMKHAGVVYPADSPIIARGKKLTINGKYTDRGETHFEGWVDTATATNYLHHVNFPFQSGDVLLIASEQQGANKIEPVLIYESKDKPQAYESRLQTIGATNLQLRTSNGYSPHLFPEFITDWGYYYAAAPRPGFMSRFLVGENGTRAPYWPTSPNSFGGQINASANGDLPGDIYRLIGGVVLRNKGATPAYAGYLASAFLLPRGSTNNRVIAPGSEDLNGPFGSKSRFFLVGARPGMVYETGTSFAAAIQVDPILPVNISVALTRPDGQRLVAAGQGDGFGSFAGPRWILDAPGIYRLQIEAEWQGYRGYMPGLPPSGGEIYVIEKDVPASAPRLQLNMPETTSFNPLAGLNIRGLTTARTVHYAAIMPGAVLDQGELPVKDNGEFQYFFNPAAFHNATTTYDDTNLVTGRPELGDVVHLTFFTEERGLGGAVYHSFDRIIVRGTKAVRAR